MTTAEALCGRLLLVGFPGVSLAPALRSRIRDGKVGGVILFRRNVENVPQVHALCQELAEAASNDLFIGVDQEGGRVARLPSPVLTLPPARTLGKGSVELTQDAGALLGADLAGLGFNLNFAPVFDVDSNPNNPVIGDRAFAEEPARVAAFASAFARGLQSSGVAACAKHFPGHGDTHQDSHLELPLVQRSDSELRELEISPFVAAIGAGVASMMTAHVVYPALDPEHPATLSSAILTQILRRELGFGGVIFSDDLEMNAITRAMNVEDAAVSAIVAGCDALLICHSEERQAAALTALVREYEGSKAFRELVNAAEGRGAELRSRYPVAGFVEYQQWLNARLAEQARRDALTAKLAHLASNGQASAVALDPTEKA
ncbi:MAG: beta-N-acetylhexosaminidase [Polyangiaceae bacterium]|nr:beta-N-acetylhexosaminidase [Polyangiaceae bacterium]